MTTTKSPTSEPSYQPGVITTPPLFAWPPQPRAALKWLLIDLVAPWGLLWIAVAFFLWQFATPDSTTAQSLEIGWLAQLWLRNAAVLIITAGTLHYLFYIKRIQGTEMRFGKRELATDDPKFLWRHQVKDNMFWSIVSGVSVWTLYEGLTYWWYANGYQQSPSISEHPVYFLLTLWGVFFWSTAHFYLNHRALHWKPLYDMAHELHHRNAVTGPWTGISMHPVEHLIYFTVFLLWWVIPVHPVIIILCGLFQGVSPCVSHSGFDYLKLGKNLKITTGDNFHNLHHRWFRVNYGNSMFPIDKLFNSWHDGSEDGMKTLKSRGRKR
jgi:lathosterol oxidase